MNSYEMNVGAESAICVADGAAPDTLRYLGLRQQPGGFGSRISRVFLRVARARRRACAGYDLSFADPDMVENDYYRFLGHPRD